MGPAGLHNPSRPPTHTPAPSRKSPLPPRAGIHRRGPFVTLPIARATSISDPARFGVGFRSTSTRCACSDTRVLSHPTPPSPSESIRRANRASRGSAPQSTGAGACLSGREAASLRRHWRSATRAARSKSGRSPERSPDGYGRALRPPGNHRSRHAPGWVGAPRGTQKTLGCLSPGPSDAESPRRDGGTENRSTPGQPPR